MSRRTFDPSELDRPIEGADHAISELDRYVTSTAADAPRGLSDHVLAAIEEGPAPRHGLVAWLTAGGGGGVRPLARATALAGLLVLAVAGAIFAGQLAGFLRGAGSDATPMPSPSVTESVSAAPSSSLDTLQSEGPSASEDENASVEEAASPEATGNEAAQASQGESSDETPGAISDESANESP